MQFTRPFPCWGSGSGLRDSNVTCDTYDSYVCVLLGAAELPKASGSSPAKKRRVDASTSKAGNTGRQIIFVLAVCGSPRWK